jgi:hypothetical protein
VCALAMARDDAFLADVLHGLAGNGKILRRFPEDWLWRNPRDCNLRYQSKLESSCGIDDLRRFEGRPLQTAAICSKWNRQGEAKRGLSGWLPQTRVMGRD